MAKLKCIGCGERKDVSDFVWRYKARGIRSSYCRVCKKLFQDQWYQTHKIQHKANVRVRTVAQRKKLRAYVVAYLQEHSCSYCGEDDLVVLDFHHRSRAEKYRTIAELVKRAVALSLLKCEIEKCVVLCANCHRRQTAKEHGGWYKAHVATT